MIIKIPITHTKETIIGTLNHEIGTHFVRKFNNKFQPWYKNKKKKFQSYLCHEEGLAVLN